MNRTAAVAQGDRESLPDLLSAGPGVTFGEPALAAIVDQPLPPRNVLAGYWNDKNGDPFPDFLLVNDEDVSDTLAWLSSYATGLAPITQWCRLWSRTQLRTLLSLPDRPALGGRLAPWVGAIIAECGAQARMQLNLRTLSGAAALSSASFAAARACAVWGGWDGHAELARRHDELSGRLRETTRPLSAGRMTGLWSALAGEGWMGRPVAEERTLKVFRTVFTRARESGTPAVRDSLIRDATDEFDLPELAGCGAGPQQERVKALDRLGARLATGPKSAAVDAVLGFGASLVEPGAAVLPDLLRAYEANMPTAPLWAGAFAGLWAPVRVLSDHGGLGRVISKALLRDHDLFAKPEADIGFDELARWLPSGAGSRVSLRGMAARSLNVELMPGVTAPFQLRPEPPQPERSAGSMRQRALDLDTAEAIRDGGVPSSAELAVLIDGLAQRVAALEENRVGARRSNGTGATPRKRKA